MSLKQRIVFNTFWSVGGQVGISVIQLAANIIYARFLTPEEFGRIGIVMFFVLFSNVLIEGGLGGALIRKIDASKKDFTTVFLFNFGVSLILYALLFGASGSIGRFYNDPELRTVLRVIGVILIINSLNFIQNTRLVKNLQFRKLSAYKLTAIILANAIGTLMAIKHFGIWALVVSIVANPFILSLFYWLREGTVGRLIFSRESFKNLYVFGVNTSLASIIDTAFNNIYQIVIGRFFSIADVGLFFQAKKLQDVPNVVTTGTMNSVVFSSLSGLQNDRDRFLTVYNRMLYYFSIVIGFITMVSIIYAREIIHFLFGEKWAGSSPYLIILAAASFFYVHEMFNRVVFKIFDRTRLILQLELIKKGILVISILVGIAVLDIEVLLIGFFVVSVISWAINFRYTRGILQARSYRELIILAKVILSIAGVYLLLGLLGSQIEMTSLQKTFTLPISILLYFLFLRLLGIKVDTKEILGLVRPAKNSNQDNSHP